MTLSVSPTLILSPDEMRDASGEIPSPIAGSGVTVVDGQYGQAWERTTGGGFIIPNTGSNTIASGDYLGSEGTVLVRFQADSHGSGDISLVAWATNNTAMWHSTTQMRWIVNNASDYATVSGMTSWATMATAYDASSYREFWNGEFLDEIAVPGGAITPSTLFAGGSGSGNDYPRRIETIVLYDQKLPDNEIIEIMNMEQAWTWENLQPTPGTFIVLSSVSGTDTDAPVITLP